MNQIEKLATLIIIETESLKTSKNLENSIALAEEITKDAIQLAKLILEGNKAA